MRRSVERMRKYFDSLERTRERILQISRDVVRASSRCISALHRGESEIAGKLLAEARKKLKRLESEVKGVPELLQSGITESAQQEYCEAMLFHTYIHKGKVLGPEEVGIPYRPYLGGLSDMVGELRRYALDLMREGKVAKASEVLNTMDEILGTLMEFDYPEAILPGMRRKQDMVRTTVEKTRGELTIAIRQHKLESELRRARR
ncbi:MAG: hypothetical protein QW567_00830 [Candidatus Hadarchaeales archaeon]